MKHNDRKIMKTRTIPAGLVIAILCSVYSTCGTATFAAVILIDQNIRNGSFESGQWDTWAPWGNEILLNDSSFASDGTYCAKLKLRSAKAE